MSLRSATFVGALIAVLADASAGTAAYKVQELPFTNAGPTDTLIVAAIDGEGRVLGHAQDTFGALLNSQRCSPAKCRTMSVKPGVAAWVDTNDAGTMAGFLRKQSNTHAAIRTHGGGVQLLPVNTYAMAVNNHGVIVGYGYGGAGFDAFVHDGEFGVLPDLGGSGHSASDINDSGVIVGFSFDGQGRQHAVKWVDRQVQDLGTLPNGTRAIANAVNASSTAVGCSYESTGSPFIAARFNPDGSVTRIGTLGTQLGSSACAYAINDAGVVVGTSDGYAFVYQGGTLHNLRDLVSEEDRASYQFEIARSINAAGQIAVQGHRTSDGKQVALRLSPK